MNAYVDKYQLVSAYARLVSGVMRRLPKWTGGGAVLGLQVRSSMN